MKQKSVKKLEVGRDYINSYNSIIVIDRVGDFDNIGFYGKTYYNNLACHNPAEWRKATEEEVIEAFERHLIHRYGEDWKTMKIKEKHPDSHPAGSINNNSYVVDFSKTYGDWRIWNNNGLLYCHGVWVERLEEVEEPEIHIQDAIKENTVIHCETEQEANRILGMAESLGYKWWMGENYENNTEWGICKSTMCYDLFNGSYSDYDYFKKNDYTIIPSTQIADLEPEKSTDWIPDLTPAPEDIKEIKAGEKADRRYALKRDILTILTVESKLNPDKKISEYLEQFKLILEVL